MSDWASVVAEAQTALHNAKTAVDLDQWKSLYLGKKGPLSALLRGLKDMEPEERKRVGSEANLVKQQLTEAFEARRQDLESAKVQSQLASEWLDLTAPIAEKEIGHPHPLSVFRREIEDVFVSMGFQVLEGPLVEDDWHNFEALNIPPSHPARDMQDTFFTTQGHVLRTHTSSVQIRTMEKIQPPFRGIAPGRVFRCEDLDASHEHTFHQVEGLLIDRDISVANMLYFLKTLLGRIFERNVEVRLRHSYFPFVEPGFELDIRCEACKGKGCPVCKKVGWVELLGCGLVHPKVLESCGIDASIWGGFAFGMGLERMVMNRYDIKDIRHFESGDLRVIRQFG